MNISEFINQHYDIIFKSDQIDSLEDAREFLLGEGHGTNDRKIHNLFINTFGEKSIVFFEEYKLLTKVDSKKMGLTINKVAAFGWDYILGGKRQRTEPDRLFESQEADELEEELHNINLKKAILLDQGADKEKIKQIDLQLCQVNKKLQLVLDQIKRNIKSYYDLRAKCLTESIDLAYTLETGFNAKNIFLIAGASHLKRATSGLEQTKIDQKAFYLFLNNRKAVILFPKGLNDRLDAFS